MAEPYFIWNGVDSRNMGIIVTDIPPAVYPEERVEEIVIPGRPGSVLRTQGTDVYNAYTLTIGIANRGTASIWEIAAWLRGNGKLILSKEPDRVYDARIIKQASAAYAFRHNYNGPVGFLVQPLKASYPSDTPVEITTEGVAGSDSIEGSGNVTARPLITLEGSGQLVLDIGTASETGSGSRIVVNLGEGGDGCVIDTDAATVTNLEGTESLTSVTELYYNGFRGLWLSPSGNTQIAWNENVTGVTIDPRWRWL